MGRSRLCGGGEDISFLLAEVRAVLVWMSTLVTSVSAHRG